MALCVVLVLCPYSILLSSGKHRSSFSSDCWSESTQVPIHGIANMLVLSIVQLLSMLALAVVLSGYERRAMALLHHRDAPIAYLLLGLGQPVADGGKLLMKGMSISQSIALPPLFAMPS